MWAACYCSMRPDLHSAMVAMQVDEMSVRQINVLVILRFETYEGAP